MKVRDVVPFGWPPTSWPGSIRGFDRVIPDLSRAVVVDATVLHGNVQLLVGDAGQTFHTPLRIEHARLRQRVAEVLSAAKGTNLETAGDLTL